MNSRRLFLSRAAVFSFGAAAGGALLSAVKSAPALAAATGGWAGKPAVLPPPVGNLEYLTLPAPDTKRGLPLMEALALRKSTREFRDADLQMQYVSNALWAAFGINRSDGKRTIPTALNKQNLIVYASLISGVWRYLPETNELVKEAHFNLSGLLGGAPMTLAYAAQGEYGGLHVGSAYQNVGLYCASAGLGNVVKSTGLEVMENYIKTPPEYKLYIIQSVGWPA